MRIDPSTAHPYAAEPAAVRGWSCLLEAPSHTRTVEPPAVEAPTEPGRGLRGRPRRRHPVLRGLLVVLLLAGLVVGHSLYGALRAPGSDSVSARVAEWARDHGGTPVINFLERVTYKKPKVGGVPKEAITVQQAGNRNVLAPAAARALGPRPPRAAGPQLPYAGPYLPGTEPYPVKIVPPPPPPPPPPRNLPAPAPIAPVASPLPDEGQWQTLQSVGGLPAIRATYLRADSTYTSYLSAVAWMDTKLLTFDLHPGNGEPGGGPWTAGASVPPDQRGDILAAFNSGFRMADSRGGFYLSGRTAGTMRDGAATMGFYADGSVRVGMWGRDIVMGPELTAARQNLDLIVDDGQVNPRIDDNSGNRWGATIGNELYVWRSGVGITENGALVYAAGPRLSAATLAQLLVRAGAVRAMEMDINTSWTIFVTYTAGDDGSSTPNKLLSNMSRPATVYDSVNSRDFIAARIKPS